MSPGFERDGFVIVPRVLDGSACAELASHIESANSRSGGTRQLLREAWCATLAAALPGQAPLSALIPSGHVAVQCTYFEKHAARNWLVPLHQDLAIPVAERVDGPALRGWSTKEGQLFVLPPAEVLAQLVALRLHVDGCGVEDGPLRVVPGSHRHGIASDEQAAAARGRDVACTLDAGDALVMRPLLLHASSKSTGHHRRRVLHFLFGPRALPHGLRWAHAA
ncbi:phytanoyl-CoA dioxygenase family protein [Aquincola sp. S2]|uniref:Phytanoyl-CoA dioxygenase family protein n=1 Tax=Pseudaquabacterium terrae TaxID=2732868 RepID=A0ABX2ES48_9BURK|nr:phytanoyl-CoA dioxygenase family protein [Aquabacterium terrae]NRF71463.1 phytanoyl-CoA dioxygenase family protein [Aquabacterium terrae]